MTDPFNFINMDLSGLVGYFEITLKQPAIKVDLIAKLDFA